MKTDKKRNSMRKRDKLPYENGTWFAVPLRTGGFAIGIVARNDGKGIVVGYFFGTRHKVLPTISDIQKLLPDQAILVCRFGNLGLLDKGWPILGKSQTWSATQWPIPVFARFDGINDDIAWKVSYSDDLSLVSENSTSAENAIQLPSNGLFSAGAVEIRLTKLLA